MLPVLFELPTPWGSLPIYGYGVMLGTSLVLAWVIVARLGHARGLDEDVLSNAFLVTAVTAIVGARALYIVTDPDEFDGLWSVFDFQRGGLVAYGGFLGGLLGAFVYLRKRSVGLAAFADITAPCLGLGLGLTRIGCYLYGCDFGARLGEDAPRWLQELGTFPRWEDETGSPAWAHHLVEYGLPLEASASHPVHPTQLYESLVGFGLLGLALWLGRRRRFDGQVILVVGSVYAVWRFAIEYVRDDPERGFYFGFSTSQLISLALVPALLFAYHQLSKRSPALADGGPSEPKATEPEPKKKKKKPKREGP